jgi:flavin-dependent dehydrogenase
LRPEYDVAIIGGGPGGSTCGCVLKKYRPDLDVAIFEREKFPRDHVGESQLPGIGAILREIGAWDKVEAANFPIKIGATYRWGVSDDLWNFHFLAEGNFTECARPGEYRSERTRTAWQVDRSVYDKILLDHAAEMGCEVFEETAVESIPSSNDAVEKLILKGGQEVRARYYIDATGHIGILRRALGVEVDEPSNLKNVAFWDYWQDAEWAVNIGSGTRVQVMSIGFGWLWFIPVSATRTSCGLVCPAEYYKQSGLKPQELYSRAIQQEPLIRRLLENATCEGKFSATKDWSFIAKRLVGPNWFLVGEAAGFADPILSAGMSLTQASAREAAYTILELDRGRLNPNELKDMYQMVSQRKIARHIKFADYWYTANTHFTDLKDFTRVIASEAGLSLTAEEAFQWLGTGGFLEDDTGRPGFAFFSLGTVKRVASKLSPGEIPFSINGYNGFLLKLRGIELFQTPYYDQGEVLFLDAGRIGDKILPLSGLYGLVVKALKNSARFRDVLAYVKKVVTENGGEYNAELYIGVLNTLEAMALDGWVKPIHLSDGSPCVQYEHHDVEGLVLAGRSGA